MRSRLSMNTRSWTGSAVLLATLVITAGSLVAWKRASARKADAAAARQPEPVESITLAVARGRQYRPTTTSVGAVAAELHPGEPITVYAANDPRPMTARIVAVDARIDPTTRNAMVRARIPSHAPAPGASVRIEVPVGPPTTVVAIPVSALRKGPGGDHVFLIVADSAGRSRAHDQPVQSGPVLDDEVVILNGLTPGQRVATSGSFKLREAVLVAGDSSR